MLQYAIKANATAVILAHNHPSGNLGASDADVSIKKRVRDALELMDITATKKVRTGKRFLRGQIEMEENSDASFPKTATLV